MLQEVIELPQPIDGQRGQLLNELMIIQRIGSESEVDAALEHCRAGKRIIGVIEDFCNPMIKKANDLHKSLTSQRKQLIGGLDDEVKRVTRVVDQYRTEQYQLEQERQRKLQEAEQARIREEREKAEAERLAHAEALEKAGHADLAERVLDAQEPEPAPMPARVAPVAPAKVAGTATRTVWEYEVTDFAAVPDQYKTLNDRLVKIAIETQDIPGIKRFETVKSAVRR